MKKRLIITMILLLSFGLFGCSSGGSEKSNASGDKVKLTVMSSTADQGMKTALTEVVKAFEKENPSIKVDLQFPGSNYENILKMKMASNDLPDLFDTHGWAIKRYGNYLADLSGEKWAANLSDTIKPVITDDKGKLYVLPLNEAKEGVLYNVEVLEKYNIEVPKTFDELVAASEKLVKESKGEVTPFYFAALDSWTIGQYFDYFANPLLISPQNNQAEALTNGSFDWSKWTFLPENFKKFYDKKLINKDMLTAKYVDEARLFAENKLAFALHAPASIADVKKINPNAKMGVFPIPSIEAGDTPTFVGGERFTLGLWKDTKHAKEAKQLLEFVSKPENIKKISDTTLAPAPFKDVTAGGEFAPFYDQYKEERVLPYFDRVFLPNGMWDVMCTLGQELIAGNITPEEYSNKMKAEVERLNKK
ncbi:extracellular solute-binding protein [Neobacillus sp. SuZ13]|uniref:ABC transporter substrate-binding protein n=1 Tax=Neobacillus sp. SuZ13 TaxID=3047875 RepID=UPI0024C08357|nr:extracellular solute-binding protein [Neobacillus sp. SuZ13]WHY64790.1 extracellular solute-binding protein [Neobacillus sp. SuZ13]